MICEEGRTCKETAVVPLEGRSVNSALALRDLLKRRKTCHENWSRGQAVNPLTSDEDAGAPIT
jgi:hypothetical protein